MYNFTNYLIIYDITDYKRSCKVLNILRGYCFHVQKSVFEGKLTKAQFYDLKHKLHEVVGEQDSIIIYPLSHLNVLNKVKLGCYKYKKSQIF